MTFTPEEITAMATEAGLNSYRIAPGEAVAVWERFAALVAAKEREACAQLAGDSYYGNPGELNHEIAAAIRARGQKEGV